MAKIIRAVLIDSINRGSCIEILLDGNTALTGTNGIGKTSFLKLLAIFYGARPGLIVKADGNNLSFGKWYLPRPTSFIIFEYENHENQRCCAVIHHSPGAGGYAYRLITGAWEPELVYQDLDSGLLVQPSEMIAHCNRLGRTSTPELNQTAYRLIMQYNTINSNLGGLEASSHKQIVQHYRPRFSLAPRRKDVAGIDTITLTLIDSGNNYDALRKIIADILQQENDDPTSTLESIQPHEFQQLIAAHAGCIAFEKDLIDRIRKLDEIGTEYHSKVAQLGKAKRRLQLLLEATFDERKVFTTKLSDLRERQRTFDDETEQQWVQIDKRLSEARVSFNEAEAILTRLDQAKVRYDAKNIDDTIERCQHQPMIQADLNARQQELAAIDRDGADLRAAYQQLIEQEKDKFQALIDAEIEQARAARAQIESEMDADEKRWLAEIERLTQAQANELEPIQAQLTGTERELGEKKSELNITRRYPVLPEDQSAMDDARNAMDDQRTLIEAMHVEELEHNRLEQTWKNDQRALADQQQAAERRKSDAIRQRDEMVAQLNASETTLLGFLRKHHDSWENNIGRVLAPDVLMRDDLNPELAADPHSASLYGVALSLEHLPPPTLTSLDNIKIEIAHLEGVLQVIEAEASSLTAQQAKLAHTRKQLDQQEHKLRQRRAQADDELAQRQAQYEGVKERAGDKHCSRCDEISLQIEQLTEAHDKLAKRIKDLVAQHGREALNLKTSMIASRYDYMEKREAAQLSSDSKVKELKAKREGNVRELESKLDAALADKGIDGFARRQLINKIKDLTTEISWIELQLPEIEKYQRWLSTEWVERSNLVRTFEAAEATRNRVERDKADFEDKNKVRSQEFKVQRTALSASLATLETTIGISERVLSQLGNVEADEQAQLQPQQTAQDIEHDVSTLRGRQNALNKDAARLFDTITSLYSHRGLQQSPHAAHIDAIARQARQQAEDMGMAWVYAVTQLTATANEFHHAQREKLNILAQSLGDKVCDSRGRLDTLHKSIISLGREATKRAKLVAKSFKSLDIDEVKIQSQIHNLEFWSSLDTFEQQYKRWRGAGDRQLPSEGYMDAVNRLERLLANGKLSTRLQDCFTLEVTLFDSGRLKSITSDQSFKASSSEGLKVLLQSMLFVSLFELLRNDADLQIVFPLDETLRLASSNYIPLLQSLNERQIVTIAGFPEGSPDIMAHFEHGYEFYREEAKAPLEIRQYVNPEPDELDALEQDLELWEVAL